MILLLMLLQTLDGMIGNRGRRVIVGTGGNWIELLVIRENSLGMEKSPVVCVLQWAASLIRPAYAPMEFRSLRAPVYSPKSVLGVIATELTPGIKSVPAKSVPAKFSLDSAAMNAAGFPSASPE